MTENKSAIGVYNLSNAAYLYYDINNVFAEIDKLYAVTYTKTETTVQSKIPVKEGVFWASNENNESFNTLLPKIKSLHQSMYGLVEAISKDKDGQFKKDELESSIPNFKEFRLLNNQFKHFSPTGVKIDVISMNYIFGNATIMDINCQFQYPNGKLDLFSWGQFVITFLKVLERYNLILPN